MKKILLLIFCLINVQISILSLELDDLAMFGAGLGAGTILHETGHVIAAKSLGIKIKKVKFTRVYVDFKNMNKEEINSKMRKVCLAGYFSQALASEYILQNTQWHTNDFAIGLFSLGIFNNLDNVYLYYIKKDYENDLGFYKRYGGNPLSPSIIMVLHSTYVLYRLFSKTDIPNHFIGNTLGIKIKF